MFSPYAWYKRLLEHSKLRWVVILLTLVYFFSPIDILPEALLSVFGLVDDGVLLSLLVSTLITVSRENKSKRQQEEIEQQKQQEEENIVDV